MVKMEQATIAALYTLDETIAKALFDGLTYPWEALPLIKDYIIKLGESLPEDRYEQVKEHVWIAKSANVYPTAYINGPAIIDEEAEVRHCAFIRGNAIVGKKAVVGNSTELKNVVLFNNVQVPHYNYVGDSILGYKSHLGAGAVTSNVKSDKSAITAHMCGVKAVTGLKKLGALVGDYAEIGCGSVLNPGSVIGRGASVYPLCSVRGYVPPDSIFKSQTSINKKTG